MGVSAFGVLAAAGLLGRRHHVAGMAGQRAHVVGDVIVDRLSYCEMIGATSEVIKRAESREEFAAIIRGEGQAYEGLLPTLADGVEGMQFIVASVESSKNDGKWTRLSDV